MQGRWKPEDWLLVIGFIGAGVALLALIVSASLSADDYEEGYCDALGGAVLNSTTCDVEGRVVKIPR